MPWYRTVTAVGSMSVFPCIHAGLVCFPELFDTTMPRDFGHETDSKHSKSSFFSPKNLANRLENGGSVPKSTSELDKRD
jgi:hypothetical protein